jgi:hypothetical protein
MILILNGWMSKYFRPWKIDQPQLLPPSVQDFVPRDHLSRFIVELVRESLGFSPVSFRSFGLLGCLRFLRLIFSLSSPHPKIPFPATGF